MHTKVKTSTHTHRFLSLVTEALHKNTKTGREAHLDAEVDEAAQHQVVTLEKLGHGKEGVGGLLGGQRLALVQQVQDLGEDVGAALHIHRRLVEHPRLLQHRRLVRAVVWVPAPCVHQE